jgi:rRNA processing protein Krr1/Pno1
MPSSPTRRVELPKRSADQRRQALAQANRVRKTRAQLKRDLKGGRVSVIELIADPPAYLASAKVMELLRALPGFGPAKATRLMESCQVSPVKSVGGLSERQRDRLIGALQQ